MLMLKHVEHEIGDTVSIEDLLVYLGETTSQVEGINSRKSIFKRQKGVCTVFGM